VEVLASGKLTIKPFGLVGHQSLGLSWNNKQRFSLIQDPTNTEVLLLQTRFPRLANPGPVLANILQRFFPALLVPALPPNHESSSWALSYSFDQYFWQPDGNPKHGIGLFFGFGASDGNPNPIQYSFITGIGGKGVVPGRPDDTFGLGVARTQFSSAFVPFLRQQLNLGLQREDAIEMYYNVSVTQWLNLTADLQIIGPGHFVARINIRAPSGPRSDIYVRRTYSGRPSSSIRFSEATAMATSVVCRPMVRERSASPITRL
jgi:porin